MIAVSITDLIRHAEKLLPKDIEPFVQACIDSPDDAAQKGVFADWLDEHDEPGLAWALRWMGRHGKSPLPMGDNEFGFCGELVAWLDDLQAPGVAKLPDYMIGPSTTWRGGYLKIVLCVAERLQWLEKEMANEIPRSDPPSPDSHKDV
jgi:uncharacterized protein (TIGR02996 family)